MSVTCNRCHRHATAWCLGCLHKLCDTCWGPSAGALCHNCVEDGRNERDAWRLHANCRGMNVDLFFPGRGEPLTAAKNVCAACPVIDACLEDALTHREINGIRGGCSEKERRRIRRIRALIIRGVA